MGIIYKKRDKGDDVLLSMKSRPRKIVAQSLEFRQDVGITLKSFWISRSSLTRSPNGSLALFINIR